MTRGGRAVKAPCQPVRHVLRPRPPDRGRGVIPVAMLRYLTEPVARRRLCAGGIERRPAALRHSYAIVCAIFAWIIAQFVWTIEEESLCLIVNKGFESPKR